MRTLINDIETFKSQFLVCFKDVKTGDRLTFEVRGEGELDYERLEKVMLRNRIITYNGMNFDVPIIFKMIQLARENNGRIRSEWAHQLAERIIKGGLKYWEVGKELDVWIPRELDHIDLIEPQPNPWASLKALNGRLHGRHMQDLPFAPDADLTDDEMDLNVDYCWNDLEATHLLFDKLQGPLELRAALSDQYGEDFRSKSDSQIGERIIRKGVQDVVGRKIERVETKPGTVFHYEPPDFIQFENAQLRSIFERLKAERFVVQSNGKVELPKWLKDEPITIGSATYTMGLGGLHSTESNRALYSDDEYVYIDADVGAYYPALIINSGLYPKSCGPEFVPVYRGIRMDRMKAKRDGDKVKDKGLKIAANGSFGKLGSPYSILYAPHLLIATTLTGQLSLLMLIDQAAQRGIDVVSGNTDGVVFKCPTDDFAGIDGVRLIAGQLKAICDSWEEQTGFDLEFTEYRAIYNQSVNSYFAVKPDGKVKQKGPYADWWFYEPDLREQMMHNPSATICGRAVIEKITNNIPVADTIRDCTDPRQFVTVVAAQTGATWRDGYLGKVVRYYWATDGDPIFRAKATAKGTFNKVPRTDGCRPLMTLPDDLPGDVNYARYVEEAEKILRDIGFYAMKPKPLDRRRRKATFARIAAWGLAL
jgi:hypothetical protein